MFNSLRRFTTLGLALLALCAALLTLARAPEASAQTATPTPTATPTKGILTVTSMTGGATRYAAGTFTVGESDYDHAFVNTGREILVVRNLSASPTTVTITSVADPEYGRSGDISQVCAAGAECFFGPFPILLFNQQSGVYAGKVLVGLSAEDADLKLAVIKPPNN